ncbi:unnamed protein product [Soboliphyme baturini]|uniref:XK-related protein n=1 Tax=Soboliphyme baturini TaxID=241478 RepID=A0A183J0M0_9BILA|nr:unnamed protein product [Soboliphyme baturini]
MHCYVSGRAQFPASEQRDRTQNAVDGNDEATRWRSLLAFDVGQYVYVIFTIKFITLWTVLYMYPQYFDRTAVFSLIMFTLLFLTFLYGSHRNRVPRLRVGPSN